MKTTIDYSVMMNCCR